MRNSEVSRLNGFLSTFNFVLCFIGYQFVTTIFLPISSDLEGISSKVTFPYRAFALLISLLVIIINVKKKISKFSLALQTFLLFWGILIIRIFYDVNIGAGVHLINTSRLWLYIFGICIPAIFSIIKSYKYIDLEKAFWWILTITALTLLISLFSNQAMFMSSEQLNIRQDGNLAFNTISYGHFGVTGILLSSYALLKKNITFIQKVFIILIILLGAFCMLRAGSRGPVMALTLIILFWSFSQVKNSTNGLLILAFLCLAGFIFLDQIINLMGSISPIMKARLLLSIYEGNMGDREFLIAIQAFLDNPIFGKQFAIFKSDGSYIYSHNIILDAFMGLGIFGGGAMIYFLGIALKKSYYLVNNKDIHFWIGLLLLQQIIACMTSGAIYLDPLLSVLLTFIFLKYRNFSHLNLVGKQGKYFLYT